MKNNAIRTPVALMILAILLLADVGLVRARNISEAEPLALKGKLLFQENFATPTSFTKQLQTIHDGWRVRSAHADWAHTDEGLRSVWTTGHMPVLVYEGNYNDAVIEVDFRFHQEPGKTAGARISACNMEKMPRTYAASIWANSTKKGDPPGLVLETEEWKPNGITVVTNKPADFESDKWYTLRLELIGNKALGSCNGMSVYGTHEKFGLQPKTSVWLTVGTSPHELRNLHVYEALPNPKWKAPPTTASISAELLPHKPLPPAVLDKIAQMTPLFNGKTLDGWIQEPLSAISFDRREITDFAALAKRLESKADPVSAYLAERLDENGKKALAAALTGQKDSRQVIAPLVKNINALAAPGVSLYDEARFKGVPLREKTQALLASKPTGADLARLNRMLLEDAFPKELLRIPESAWVADNGVLKSTGAGRGVIYTDKNYSRYRLVFQVRQSSGDHFPGVLLFCQRPEPGLPGLDALGGIQFAVPNGGHWDYRPGINKSGTHFIRPLRINFNLKEWAQVEILADATTGVAKMAVAQPVGATALEVLSFNDPAIVKSGPIALQMHNALLFDEYKDIRIEVDPKENRLITAY